MKGRIKLPIRVTPASELKKISIKEFYTELKKNPKVCEIFRDYAKTGGNPSLLLHYLWIGCCPPVKFTNEVVTDTIGNLKKAVEHARLALRHHADLLPPRVLDKKGLPFLDALRYIRTQLNNAQFVEAFLNEKTANPGVGRPPGADPGNFAAAVLDMEFMFRYGHPRLADIVTLIATADPNRFEMVGNTRDSIRLTINRLRDSESFDRVRKYWVGMFGAPETFPDRRFTDWSDPS